MALRVRVCRAAEVVAGALRAFPVAGVTWPVVVTAIDGAIVAMPGVCPHDDVELGDYGVVEGTTVRCRVHGYQFDVTTGRCEHDPRLYLRRYKVTVVDDDVWVDLL